MYHQMNTVLLFKVSFFTLFCSHAPNVLSNVELLICMHAFGKKNGSAQLLDCKQILCFGISSLQVKKNQQIIVKAGTLRGTFTCVSLPESHVVCSH